jgi:hypothetical protein
MKVHHPGSVTGLDLMLTWNNVFISGSQMSGLKMSQFFRMLPDSSLSTVEYTKGPKKAKDRITVALCCSSDGSEKMKPYVIRKALKPRCFRNFNVNLYADYTANKKA